MSEICKTRRCTNDKYNDYDRCIFHCDKSGFDDTDIRFFWEKIRDEYVTYNGRWDISEEITIEGVIFPYFKDNHRNKRFFINYNHFSHNVKFIKCVFTDDCDLFPGDSLKKMTFDNCTFQGNIKLVAANEIEIIDSEFKNEVILGNGGWKNLLIKNTKFIKDISLIIKDNLSISDDCIFRANLKIDGGGSLNLDFENSLCSKHLSVQSTDKINLDSVGLKSVSFDSQNNNIEITNVNFLKDVSFNAFTSLSVFNTEFNKKINFNADFCKHISIDNTKINDITLPSGSILNIINNSEIRGSLKLEGSIQNINIEKSKFNKEVDINGTSAAILKDSQIQGSLRFNHMVNDVTIDNCSLIDLEMSTTHTLKINHCQIIGKVDLFGDQYVNVVIENSKVSNIIEIKNAIKLEFNSLISNSSVKLINDECEDISIKNSKFTDIEIASVKNLNILNTTVKGNLSLLGVKNGNIAFDAVSLNNKCEFHDIDTLFLNKSKFLKEINLDKIRNIKCHNTYFNSEVMFLAEYVTIELKECEFHQKMRLFKVSNMLEIKSSSFKDEVDLSNSEFNIVNIFSSSFESKLLLSTATIQKINLDATAEELSENNLFASLVDFSDSFVGDIEICNCDFNGELNFIGMKKQLNLSNITGSKIESLTVSNSLVINLFKNSNGLVINQFVLENSKLDTTSTSDEIDINYITFNEFKWNKVILLKVINFYEMSIGNFIIENSNIEHRFRVKESDIGVFNLKSSTFEDLQIIDNKSNFENGKRKLLMTNTTIKNAVLDKLEYDSFIMNSAHVSEAKIGNVKFEKGSRETNRFFKNYYDSISDYIQANNYYRDEMFEHYKKVKKYSSEWFVLDFGKGISNFGQCWFKPLFWMVLLTLAVLILIYSDKFTSEYIFNHKLNMWNGFWEFLNPFSKSVQDKYEDWYGVWMIHKLLMTVFIYHFIVAIKRKTKR